MNKVMALMMLVALTAFVVVVEWPHASSPPLKIGQKLQYEGEGLWGEVQVKNLNPIGHFHFNDGCEPYGHGTLMARALDGGRTLVAYHTKEKVRGYDCPDGTLFFMDNTEIRAIQAVARQRSAEDLKQRLQIQKDRAEVQLLLSH